MTISVSRIVQIAMPIRDTQRAVRFYRDTLGLPLLFEAPPGLAFFDCGGVRLMLSPVELAPEFQPPASELFFATADIGTAHRDLVARGVVFRRGPTIVAKLPDRSIWVADFEDGEGNVLALMEERMGS